MVGIKKLRYLHINISLSLKDIPLPESPILHKKILLKPQNKKILLKSSSPLTESIKSKVKLPVGSIPETSNVRIIPENGSIYYRSIYYFSTNIEKPFVCLITHYSLEYPCVICCSKEQYDFFLQCVKKGEFKDTDLMLCIPIAYRELVADL